VQTTEDLSFKGIEVDTMGSIVVGINTVGDGQQSVDLLADSADLPLEGVEVDSA